MEYRNLGNSGLIVSVLGLGCNNFGGRMDIDRSRTVVDAAIDHGITFFDTADIYGNLYGNIGGSETALGELLSGKRDRVVLATKFGYPRRDMGYGVAAGAKGGRAYVRRALEESLRRLRTDYIDLYQLHGPDPTTPMAETLAALHEVVLEGKVRYIGHSNLNVWQLSEADHVAVRTASRRSFQPRTDGRCSIANGRRHEVGGRALRPGHHPLHAACSGTAHG